MSESKHYPGPWLDSPEAGDAIIANTESARYPAESEMYGGALVAESILPCNKALIKAAPDLLEACGDVVGIVQASIVNARTRGEYPSIIESMEKKEAALRAAIAKAKGATE